MNLKNLDDPASEIEVLCSGAIAGPVKRATLPLLKANYEVSLCAFDGGCNAAKSRKVRRLADRAAVLVGQVRSQI